METPENWPVAYTADGVKVVPGLRVLDYNYRVSTVTDRKPHESHGVYWFATTGGDFDGSRMLANHPDVKKEQS